MSTAIQVVKKMNGSKIRKEVIVMTTVT